MKNPILMILVLALLLVAVVSPFSALSILMLFLLVSAFGWALWTMVQTVVQGNSS